MITHLSWRVIVIHDYIFALTDPPIGPPIDISVMTVPSGGVLLTWQPPESTNLLGYKINYGSETEPPEKVALHSTDAKTQHWWVGPSVFSEYRERVVVLVWAYSLEQDGETVSVIVTPFGRE